MLALADSFFMSSWLKLALIKLHPQRGHRWRIWCFTLRSHLDCVSCHALQSISPLRSLAVKFVRANGVYKSLASWLWSFILLATKVFGIASCNKMLAFQKSGIRNLELVGRCCWLRVTSDEAWAHPTLFRCGGMSNYVLAIKSDLFGAVEFTR